jgi:hypothetical protein
VWQTCQLGTQRTSLAAQAPKLASGDPRCATVRDVPAALANAIERLHEVAEELPEADMGLLAPLTSSVEFLAVRDRLVSDQPADAWKANMLHYFPLPIQARGSGGRPNLSSL